MCWVCLPVAVMPLWQLEQVPGDTLVWSKTAGVQAVVLWQSSQVLPLGRWLPDLPVAVVPLWQAKQVPMTSA